MLPPLRAITTHHGVAACARSSASHLNSVYRAHAHIYHRRASPDANYAQVFSKRYEDGTRRIPPATHGIWAVVFRLTTLQYIM